MLTTQVCLMVGVFEDVVVTMEALVAVLLVVPKVVEMVMSIVMF